MEEEVTLSPAEIIAIARRRKWSFILPFFAIVLTACAIALLLPSIYQSSATILIEKQEIPTEFVGGEVTAFAEQRIQSIQQRVMASSRLKELVETYGLYSELHGKKTPDEIASIMANDISLTPVNVEIADRKTGRSKTATIAFTISYEGKEPDKVQKVANTITSLFLKEDLEIREQQADETLSFLDEEKERIKSDLENSEGAMATFKEVNIHSLPEVLQMNMQTLATFENSVEREKEQLRSLFERQSYIETQLVSINPGTDLQEESRLKQLEMELANLKSKYSDIYPSVKKKKAEIEEVRAIIETKGKKADNRPDNPAFITLSSQLASTRSDISSTKRRIIELTSQAAEYRRRIVATPRVEEEYNSLIMERNNLRTKFDELQQKTMAAKVAKGLQTEQKAERFTLIEPARYPEKPLKPNRLAIMLIGIVLGIGVGVASVSLSEFSDNTIRDPEALERASGFPVLAVIPEIITHADRIRSRKKHLAAAVALIALMGIGIWGFNSYVMDIDMLRIKLMQQVNNK